MSLKSIQIPLDASSFYNRKAIAALDLEVESESGEAMVKKVSTSFES